jgi:hypothetical protein
VRVIVCGGRKYEDDARVRAVLDAGIDGQPITEIAEGGAHGVDEHADEWAVIRGVPSKTYNAHWPKHGKAAGPIRNAEMLANFKPDAVIAFPGGTGTADMVRKARAAGVRVIEVTP